MDEIVNDWADLLLDEEPEDLSEDDLCERARKGAAWLDEVEPNWDQQIDVDELLLESCCRCVMGQIYGTFNHGILLYWGRDPSPAYDLGLLLAAGASRDDYARLTDAWKKIILERRTQA